MLRILGIVVLLAVLAVACAGNEKGEDIRNQAVEQRIDTFQRAESLIPVPQTENFPLRAALAEMTVRQDLINHPWYVYILGMNGNVIGYYVAQTVPVNACNFLSSTEVVREGHEDKYGLVLTAPSLDGIFYGGAGASSGCDAWFFFDYATDALIQIRGVNFFTADQPLRLDADPITVAEEAN